MRPFACTFTFGPKVESNAVAEIEVQQSAAVREPSA
jgi:hypothetical protein